MEEWVDNFDVEIHKLTSGDNDLTLATQLEKVNTGCPNKF